MIFNKQKIKSNFLNILILSSLTFNITNLNASPEKNSPQDSKNIFKSLIETIKSDPVGFALFATIFTGITAACVAFIASEINKDQTKKNDYDKKLRETCIVCEKINKECSCDLLEKIKYVFNNHNLIETRYYVNNRYTHRSCNWLTKKIKSVILKINDINMKFHYNNDDITLLHIACYYGHEPIIKWLIEDMFADMSIANGKNISASQTLKNTKSLYTAKSGAINEKSTSRHEFLSKIDGCLLDKKAELQNELIDNIKSIKNLLQENKSEEILKIITPDIKSKLKVIKNLMNSKTTPGFAKQLVMSELLFLNQNFKEFISDKWLEDCYKNIAFNYTFLHDSRFSSAAAYAETKSIKDIYGRTIAQAREIYIEENKEIKCERFEDFIEFDYFSSNSLY